MGGSRLGVESGTVFLKCWLGPKFLKTSYDDEGILTLCSAKATIATWNEMKLVHWPLMGGLLQFVQPTHQRPVHQSPYCCIMVPGCAVLILPVKG